MLSNIYDDIGDYVNAFKAVQEGLAISKGYDRQNELLSMVQMGRLFKNIGDYETATDPVKTRYSINKLKTFILNLYIHFCFHLTLVLFV